MKTTTYILAASLFAPVLLTLSLGVVAAASLVVLTGMAAIVYSDYGRSAEPSYSRVPVAAKSTLERLPFAA